jgi:hypothetical protein
MTCHEVALAEAICRIEISNRTADKDMPLFAARMWLVDRSRKLRHSLVAADGSQLELHGPTEGLALNSAITFLEGRFGGLSEYAHGCDDFGSPLEVGVPLVIDGRESTGGTVAASPPG